MRVQPSDPPRILVAEYDQSIAELFSIFLQGEGYQVSLVPSVERALERIDEQTFRIVLTDLFIEDPTHPFKQVRPLLQCCPPMPIGLITGWQITPEEAKRRGFAFLLQKPFDLDLMLTEIAACLALSLTSEQERQVLVLRRFAEAIKTNTLREAADLLTEDITYYPPLLVQATNVQRVKGREALLTYFEKSHARYHNVSAFDEWTFYPRPNGWAMRYHSQWTADDGSTQHLTGTYLFHLQGEQIHQVGTRLSDERLRALMVK
jgi:DNA-binding response OmpR family regulator